MIPARYASTRFPGKPLVMIAGKPMIVRTYEQAKKAHKLTKLVVATDDIRIKEAGGEKKITHTHTHTHTHAHTHHQHLK